MKFLLALLLFVAMATPSQARDKRDKEVNEGAKLVFEQQEYDFGTINRKGEDRECVFRFENKGIEPLVILSAQTSCSCVKASFSRKPIPPQGVGEIHLRLESRKMEEGIFHRVIQIKSNSTTGIELLTIKGRSE